MEVPGKKRPKDVDISSADATIYCIPCTRDDSHIPADGFCNNCKEYLCSSCIRVHRKLGITQNHVVLGNDKMPSFYPTTKHEDQGCTEPCPHHSSEVIKFFCPVHDALNCGDCVVLNHRNCKIDYIPDIAKDLKQGQDFKLLNSNIDKLNNDTEGFQKGIENCLKIISDEAEEKIKQIRLARDELIAYFDKREKELVTQINGIKKANEDILNTCKKQCYDVKTKLDNIKSKMKSQERNINQLFTTAQQSKHQLAELQSSLASMNKGTAIKTYQFHKDQKTSDLIKTPTALGTIEGKTITPFQHISIGSAVGESLTPRLDLSKAKFRHEVDINIKTTLDFFMFSCSVTGMALLPDGNALVTDYFCGSMSVKLLDTKNHTVLSQVKLSGQPLDVCLLSPTKAAVTLPYMGIQFLAISGSVLSQKRDIKLAGDCKRVDYCDKKLYVCFGKEKKIVAMDLNGTVLNNLDNEIVGKELFSYLSNLKITEGSRKFMYVSDSGNHTVIKLSLTLQVLAIFKNPVLVEPHGLALLGDSQLAVCGQGNNSIFLLDTATGTMTILLREEDGIRKPYSVSFNANDKKLFSREFK